MCLRSTVAALLPLLATMLLSTSSLSAAEGSKEPEFKLKVERDGAYRVAFDDLVAAGYSGPALPSTELGLSRRSTAIPIWVSDGGDGLYGPGDWIEFVGEHLRGETTYLDEHTRYNVYWLRTRVQAPARLRSTAAGETSPSESTPPAARTRRRRHDEEDLLLIRLPAAGDEDSRELWFWQRMVQGHKAETLNLGLADLDRSGNAPEDTVRLRVDLLGWSTPVAKGDAEIADHVVDIRLNGVKIASESWNGSLSKLVELEVPAGSFAEGDNELTLKIPKRSQADGKTLVDVILLNWIEVEYPYSGRMIEPQAAVRASGLTQPVRFESQGAAGSLLIYGSDGSRRVLAAETGGPSPAWSFVPKTGETDWLAVAPDGLLAPESVVLERPSRLAASDRQADYIMISHRRFLESVMPLAELHRRRGLSVDVVDLEDIYDEFNDGIAHPQAIRSFLDHAYHQWQSPRPRFVLLVGDASWDGKNARAVDQNYADWTFRRSERDTFAKNGSTLYAEGAELNQRHFVPTWNYGTSEGHAASDNYFVTVEGDDDLPDMAIGRFAVADPSEVSDIVAKTIRYVERPEPGDWQRRVLFVTNEEQAMQSRTEQVVDTVTEAGFTPLKVYPESTEVSNEANTSRLIEAFDGGLLAVQFLGHGGRYIWRTGPPDLKKNHDLFTLEHLDQLAPTSALPVVLSLTCYSAPFDHPNADSIGEKFLRLPDRGAIGVIAASWRNNPSPLWGQALMKELTTPGATVGEALMQAKHDCPQVLFVNTYNLLGDPAVPLALPDVPPAADSQELTAEKPLSNTIRWSTASEVDNFGFVVYRGTSAEGPFEQLNEEIIEGAMTTDEPQSYAFVDDTIDPYQTYYYYVESVSLSGIREHFTPIGEAKAKRVQQDDGGGIPVP